MARPEMGPFRNYLIGLQDRICAALEAEDGEARFLVEEIDSPNGGLSRPRVLADGPVIEKAAVQFTHSIGPSLPPAATERNPHLAGRGFQAAAVSMIVHPRNPYAPTTHMNIRFFLVDGDTDEPGTWYFGGGFDLTPIYGSRRTRSIGTRKRGRPAPPSATTSIHGSRPGVTTTSA